MGLPACFLLAFFRLNRTSRSKIMQREAYAENTTHWTHQQNALRTEKSVKTNATWHATNKRCDTSPLHFFAFLALCPATSPETTASRNRPPHHASIPCVTHPFAAPRIRPLRHASVHCVMHPFAAPRIHSPRHASIRCTTHPSAAPRNAKRTRYFPDFTAPAFPQCTGRTQVTCVPHATA